MKSLTLSPVLFGMDLRSLGKDWSQALRLMANWPVIRWLTPQYITRLTPDQGPQIDCLEHAGQATPMPLQAKASAFVGRVLAPSQVLWHTLQLPSLAGDALESAVMLEAQRLSPFAPEDQLWAYALTPSASPGTHSVLLAMTARHLLPANAVSLDLPAQEVWAQHPGTGTLLMFKGFGEARRYRKVKLWRGLNLLLVALTLLVLSAAAVTPSAQLHFRQVQAYDAFIDITQKAAPAMAERERMTQANAQVQQLQTVISSRMIPENVLLLLTRYLPDDTYLIVLDIKGNKVNITGQTPNAIALMQQLGKQPGVSKVVAPNPARREGNKETFNIEFTLEPVPVVDPV
jgi:general secretion pathway protein L